MKHNTHIIPDSYYQCLVNGVKFDGQNIGLQLKNGSMSRITVSKTVLTGCHTKAVCCENGCCMPFVKGAKYASA